VEQAINAGLALSCYARLALHGMVERGVPPRTFLEVQRLLEQTVIDLCKGQYMDIHYQQARSPDSIPTVDEYLEMVRLKTGVLLGTSCEVGALVADAVEKRVAARQFGEALGIAFQFQDDILGVWGDVEGMGKAATDLVDRKWGLPLVLAMQRPSRVQDSRSLLDQRTRDQAAAMVQERSHEAEGKLRFLFRGQAEAQFVALLRVLASRQA
jgi:geranylgeranyl diphosphate synthase type I